MGVKLVSSSGGSVELVAPTTASNYQLTVPATADTLATQTYASQFATMRNRIINGAMMIDQRNAGASVTPTNNAYMTDRWRFISTQASKFTAQQNAGSLTPPAGFANYLGFTSSSAYSVLSTDNFDVEQRIEGNNIADLAWGTASAATVTLSFWVRSSLTGTFGLALSNGTIWYAAPYTISSANTWEYKTVVVPGATTGTWATDNSLGLLIRWSLGTGSTYLASSSSWGATSYYGWTGQQNVVGTNGATFYITGVQLEKGSTATSFDYRPYGTELALCQRYYEVVGIILLTTVTNNYQQFFWAVPKRAAPTLTLTAASGSNGAVSNFSQSTLASCSGGFQSTPHTVDINASVAGAIEL